MLKGFSTNLKIPRNNFALTSWFITLTESCRLRYAAFNNQTFTRFFRRFPSDWCHFCQWAFHWNIFQKIKQNLLTSIDCIRCANFHEARFCHRSTKPYVWPYLSGLTSYLGHLIENRVFARFPGVVLECDAVNSFLYHDCWFVERIGRMERIERWVLCNIENGEPMQSLTWNKGSWCKDVFEASARWTLCF